MTSAFTEEQLAVLEQIKAGASSSWILTSSALIFFMQLGFIALETSVSKRQHWATNVMKNLLDSITGALGFWLCGFGIAFSKPESRGWIGINGEYYASKGWDQYTSEDLWLKFLFQFAFVNTSSTIVSGLLTERCRTETYAVFSFIMSLFIYPVVACWVWNPEGWLFLKGFHDFAGSGVVHLLGGISGLVGCIFVGPRLKFTNKVQFPFFFGSWRQKRLQHFKEQEEAQVKHVLELSEVKELIADGTLQGDDIQIFQKYVFHEYHNQNFDPEPEAPLLFAIGTFVLWLGWYFFNGGSTYSLYGSVLSSKVITNTTLAGAAGGAAVYFIKKPIHLFFSRCSQEPGQHYQTFRRSQRQDVGSVCNGILAGLVAITAPCDAVEPWAAIIIGIIAAFCYSCFSRLLIVLNVDDPLEAASVHYINGVWGLIACAIFDMTKGFCSNAERYDKGAYLGVQIYGALAITAWGILCALLFFIPMQLAGWMKYHPVIEMLGTSRMKMGEFNQTFLAEMRRVVLSQVGKDLKISEVKCSCSCATKPSSALLNGDKEEGPASNNNEDSDGEFENNPHIENKANKIYAINEV